MLRVATLNLFNNAHARGTAVRLRSPDPDSITSLAVLSRVGVTSHDACTDLGASEIVLRVRLGGGADLEVPS